MAVRGIVIVLSLSLINMAISRDKKWNLFVFAQQWPPTACLKSSLKHKCNHVPNQVKTWTVHGLWPNFDDEEVMSCNNSWHFNWDMVKSLEKQLNASWPNMLDKTRYRWLWKHEWQKHGTCAATLKATDNQLRYFQKALSLNSISAFNPQKALEKAGITPSCSKAYSIDAIKDAVKKYFRINTNLKMKCSRQTKMDRTLLQEIHIALTKTFNVTTLLDQPHPSCMPKDKIYILPFHDIHCSK
ncbi:ribonuclease Oy-like [Haliotis rufescens]|uniref:ribonuclease Oy-like n=1 Tax=Haliotis rufescens TaxID=6454 RepID=UPI00201EA81B|nr:ribonuclease Oy-like [Haliotis rufescens]XP_046359121.2 ribonuclease Oy-like [Haliotis rufescens]XP_046359122.2 ribonuclease Oy-like [Haliotis rufescens]XP_048259841.1 ribonuclease Oy-like [Haliotis rufescens]